MLLGSGSRFCALAIALCVLVTREAHSQQFVGSDLRCSSACMQTAASETGQAPQWDGVSLGNGNALADRYKALADRVEGLNTADSVLRFALVEAPASFVKDAADWLPIGGNLANDLIDKGIEALKEKSERDVAIILRTGLRQLEQEGASGFESQDGESRLLSVENALRGLKVLGQDERLFEAIDSPRQQNELQQSAIRLLTSGLADLRRQVAVNTGELVRLKGRVDRVGRQVGQLQESVAELRARKSEVEASAAARAKAVDDVDRERLHREEVRQFLSTSKTVTTQLNAAAGILQELGAPEAARVVSAASGAVDLAGGIALCTVNPAAILPTVLNGVKFIKGLLGGGPDPVQAALTQIIKLQQQILGRLAAIESQIRRNHSEVMAALSAINHNVLINTEWLRQEVVVQLQRCVPLIRPGAVVPLAGNPPRAGFLNVEQSTRFASYESYGAHATAAIDHIGTCKDALANYFQPIAGSDSPAHLIFRLSDARFVASPSLPVELQGTFNQRVEAYKRRIASKNLEVLGRYIKSEFWPDLAIGRLTLNDIAGRSLRERPRRNSQTHTDYLLEVLGTPLSATAVRRYGGWLAATHFYFELTDDRHRPIQRRRLLGGQRGTTTGEALLSWALVLADAAIAQQALEHGDVLIPLLWQAWQSPSDDALLCGKWSGSEMLRDRELNCALEKLSDQGKKVAAQLRSDLLGAPEEPNPPNQLPNTDGGGLLRANPILARNLVLFAVHERLTSIRSNSLAYRLALEADPLLQMPKDLLGDALKLYYRETADEKSGLRVGWYTVINNTSIMLPSADEVKAGLLALQPEYLGLLDTRRRISEELTGYTFVRTLSRQDLTDVQRLLMSGITFDR